MIETILTGGGSGGLVVAMAYAYRQWQASRREHRAEPRTAATSAVTDAAAANSMILAALQEEREDNARNAGRIADLETQNALLYEKLRDQRREYEREIGELRTQLTEVSNRLAGLQTRLRREIPDTPTSP